MALDVSADNLYREIDAAIAHRKAVTDQSKERRRRTLGPDYRSDMGPIADEHENHGIEFCENFIPDLAFYDPQFEVSSDLLDPNDPQLQAMHQAMNCWSMKTRLGSTLQLLAWDVCHDFGVSIVTLETVPGYGDDPDADTVPLYPVCKRISPTRFFADSQADEFGVCRLLGHFWIRDKATLLDAKGPDGQPLFDPEVIRNAGEDGLDTLRKEQNEYQTQKYHADRKQVVGYEVYVPEKGLIYTLCKCPTPSTTGTGAAFAREPRPYIGPRKGPYTIWGVSPVTEQLYPLAPLASTEGLQREINAHAGQASDDAGAAKRILVTGRKDLVEGVKSYNNGTILQLPGFNKDDFVVVETGGAQPANIDHLDRLRERLDRRSGLSQNQRGNITGATATEVNQTQASSDKRTRLAQKNFQGKVVEMCLIAAQQMHDNDQVRFPITVKDPITGQKMPKVFIGGPQPGMPYTPFEALNIKIKPYSDSFVDEAVLQKRAQEATTVVLEMAPALVANPQIKGRPLLDDLFATINIEGGGERYIDFGILAQMQGMAAQAAMAQAMPGAAPGGGGPGGPPAAGGDAGTAADPSQQDQTGMGAGADVHEQAAMLAEAATA